MWQACQILQETMFESQNDEHLNISLWASFKLRTALCPAAKYVHVQGELTSVPETLLQTKLIAHESLNKRHDNNHLYWRWQKLLELACLRTSQEHLSSHLDIFTYRQHNQYCKILQIVILKERWVLLARLGEGINLSTRGPRWLEWQWMPLDRAKKESVGWMTHFFLIVVSSDWWWICRTWMYLSKYQGGSF